MFSVNVLAIEMLLLPVKFPFASLMQLLSGGVMLYLCFCTLPGNSHLIKMKS